jgi:hypothetical protein
MSNQVLHNTLPNFGYEFESWHIHRAQKESHLVLTSLCILRVFPLGFYTFSKHAQSADPLSVTLDVISTRRKVKSFVIAIIEILISSVGLRCIKENCSDNAFA